MYEACRFPSAWHLGAVGADIPANFPAAHLCRCRCRLGREAMRGTLSPLTRDPPAAAEEVEPEGAGEAVPLGAAAAVTAAEGRVITGPAAMGTVGKGAAGAGAMLQGIARAEGCLAGYCSSRMQTFTLSRQKPQQSTT